MEHSGGADLNVNGNLPIGEFAQIVDLDGEVIGAGPIGMATRGTLNLETAVAAHFVNVESCWLRVAEGFSVEGGLTQWVKQKT